MEVLDNKEMTYFEGHAEEILSSLGVSKAQLSKALDVAPQNAKKLIATKNVLTLKKISDYLSISLDFLINGKEGVAKNVHGCIYVDGEAHLVNSKEELERLIEEI